MYIYIYVCKIIYMYNHMSITTDFRALWSENPVNNPLTVQSAVEGLISMSTSITLWGNPPKQTDKTWAWHSSAIDARIHYNVYILYLKTCIYIHYEHIYNNTLNVYIYIYINIKKEQRCKNQLSCGVLPTLGKTRGPPAAGNFSKNTPQPSPPCGDPGTNWTKCDG